MRKHTTWLKNFGFDPNFSIQIVRDRELNEKLFPKSGIPIAAPVTARKAVLPEPILKRRKTTDNCSRRLNFDPNVTVYTVSMVANITIAFISTVCRMISLLKIPCGKGPSNTSIVPLAPMVEYSKDGVEQSNGMVSSLGPSPDPQLTNEIDRQNVKINSHHMDTSSESV